MEAKWEQKITAVSALLCQFLTGWNLSLAKTTYMFKIYLEGWWINFLLFPKQTFFSNSSDECVTPWIISIYHQSNSTSNIFWVRKHPVMPQGTVMCSECSWDTQVVYNRWYWACVLGRAAWHLLWKCYFFLIYFLSVFTTLSSFIQKLENVRFRQEVWVGALFGRSHFFLSSCALTHCRGISERWFGN